MYVCIYVVYILSLEEKYRNSLIKPNSRLVPFYRCKKGLDSDSTNPTGLETMSSSYCLSEIAVLCVKLLTSLGFGFVICNFI